MAGCEKPLTASDPNVDYYTCTMHPSVRLHDPNDHCPICGMNVVPVLKHAEQVHSPAEFTVPIERQQQIGVTYAAVTRMPLKQTVHAVGIVMPDKTLHWEFVARVDGYVQKLLVTSPGEIVEKDQPLLTLYSPDLFTAESELAQLLAMRDAARSTDARAGAQSLIDSAKRRLALWNVTASQIADLERTRQPSEYLTLLSPFRGVVEAVPVDQGRNVKIGDHLVDVADFSRVWVWADIYENEIASVRIGQAATLTAAAYPGEAYEGRISLIDPFLNETQRTARLRIDLANPDFKLRPGMYLDATLAGGASRDVLTIPISAVMPTGRRNLAFVDKGEGRIEPRAVLLGQKDGERYEVKDGLDEGERVVASANFLIDAEAKVQGALQSFEEAEPR